MTYTLVQYFQAWLEPTRVELLTRINSKKIPNTACRVEVTDSAKRSSLLPGNTKGGSITVPMTSCLTSLESAV